MRLTICTFEVPGYGGASTMAYAIFRDLLESGADVSFINLVRDTDKDILHNIFGEVYGNPEKLANVHTCHLSGSLFNTRDAQLGSILEDLSPDIILCGDFIASAIILGQEFGRPLVNYSSGSYQAKQHIMTGLVSDAQDFLRFLDYGPYPPNLLPDKFEPYRNAEYDAVVKSDLTITHSPLTQKLFYALYPQAIGKIYPDIVWKSEINIKTADRVLSRLNLSSLEFSEREYDILFVASDWDRIVKNYPLVARLVEELGEEHEVHIVGKYPYSLPKATHHGFIPDRSDLFELMVNSKTLVCPSLFDAAPGVLWEASLCGCNVIASKNCGNWMICNPDLLVDPFTEAGFIEAIRRSLKGKIPDKIDLFQKGSLGNELWQICELVLMTSDAKING